MDMTILVLNHQHTWESQKFISSLRCLFPNKLSSRQINWHIRLFRRQILQPTFHQTWVPGSFQYEQQVIRRLLFFQKLLQTIDLQHMLSPVTITPYQCFSDYSRGTCLLRLESCSFSNSIHEFLSGSRSINLFELPEPKSTIVLQASVSLNSPVQLVASIKDNHLLEWKLIQYIGNPFDWVVWPIQENHQFRNTDGWCQTDSPQDLSHWKGKNRHRWNSLLRHDAQRCLDDSWA